MKDLLEYVSIIDTLYETTEIASCAIIVDTPEEKALMRRILQLKLYPTLLCKMCVYCMDDIKDNEGDTKILITKAQVVVACKSLIYKYGFSFLNSHIYGLNNSTYRYSLIVV